MGLYMAIFAKGIGMAGAELSGDLMEVRPWSAMERVPVSRGCNKSSLQFKLRGASEIVANSQLKRRPLSAS